MVSTESGFEHIYISIKTHIHGNKWVIPHVVTTLPLTTHKFLPRIHFLVINARTSTGNPTRDRTNSTIARLISIRL